MIDSLHLSEQLGSTLLVEKQIQTPARSNTHVVITFGANFGVSLKVWTIEHRIALDAFLPQALWHARAAFAVGTPNT